MKKTLIVLSVIFILLISAVLFVQTQYIKGNLSAIKLKLTKSIKKDATETASRVVTTPYCAQKYLI